MPPAPSRSTGYLTFAILAASSLTIMANATISPGLPGLEAHFADVPNIRTLAGLVVTLPSLFVILAAGVFGWLADRMDRRVLITWAMVIYAVGGTSGLYLSSIEGLLAGRAVLGLGVAGTMTLAITLAGDLFKGDGLRRYMSLQSSAMAAGGVAIVLIGGGLAVFGWRYPFLVYLMALPIALIVRHALSGHDTRPPGKGGRPDERPTSDDPFPWRMLGPVYLAAVLFMASFYLVPTRLPFLLDDLGVTSAGAVGAAMAIAMLVSIPGALLYPHLRRVMSPQATFALGFGLMGLGLIAIAPAQGFLTVLPGAMIVGAGMGVLMPNFSTFVVGRLPERMRGRGSGLLTLTIFGGQFVSPFASAPVAETLGLPATFLAFGAVMAVIGAGVALLGLGSGTLAAAGTGDA